LHAGGSHENPYSDKLTSTDPFWLQLARLVQQLLSTLFCIRPAPVVKHETEGKIKKFGN